MGLDTDSPPAPLGGFGDPSVSAAAAPHLASDHTGLAGVVVKVDEVILVELC